MFIPDPGSWFFTHPGSRIPDPGSRIPDPRSKNSNKRERWKKICCHTFLCSHKFHKIVNYFSFEVLKKKIWANFQRIKELFTKKIVKKLWKIWSWDPGSEIRDRDPEKTYSGSRIPDPGVKKHPIPDPGSRIRIRNTGCRSFLSLQKSLDPQIASPQITNPQIKTKIGFENRKFAKCHICGRSAKLTNCFKSANLWICDLRNIFAASSNEMETEENCLWLRWSLLGENLQRTYKIKITFFCIQNFPFRGTVPGTIGVRQYSY